MLEDSKELRVINDIILHSENSMPEQANSDEQLIALWIYGRSRHTQRYYKSDLEKLRQFVGKALRLVILADLQRFTDSLDELDIVAGTKRRTLASVKSLFAFGFKLGYFPFDTARPLKVPKPKDTLTERILSESEVQKIIALEPCLRNQLLIRVLYASAIRVSELSSLLWSDLQAREEAGQLTVFGKGSKTNVILIPEPLWTDLMAFRQGAADTSPVFKSRKGGLIHPGHILRIIKKAAIRAGITRPVSPHWFRHSHATHAIAHGADLNLVKTTLNHSSLQTTGKYLHARPSESSSKYLTV